MDIRHGSAAGLLQKLLFFVAFEQHAAYTFACKQKRDPLMATNPEV
jgi:hypothetical protein